MKILRDAEMPPPDGLWTYRETAWAHLAFGLVLAGIALGSASLPFIPTIAQNALVYYLATIGAVIFGLIARMAFRLFRASRRAECWQLRWSAEALYVRFRAYHNHRFPADTPTIVKLDRREVAWIRPRNQDLNAPNTEGAWSQWFTIKHLEIALRRTDPGPLADALRAEAQQRDWKRSRFNHYPVTLHGDAIHVELRSPKKALAALARYFPTTLAVEPPAKAFDDMSTAEKEDHILALIQSGNTIAAVKAARDVYGCDLATAKSLVDDLSTR